MFIYNIDPTLTYIGSSLNIGRRLNEYSEILSEVRVTNNVFTKLLYQDKKNNGSNWTAIILTLCDPSEIRLYEQFAIYLFNPKLNSIKNISVNTRYNTEDLTRAIQTAENIQNMFSGDDIKFLRFKSMKEDLIQMSSVYSLAKDYNIDVDIKSMNNGKPVLVYSAENAELINYYSSSHRAIKGLKIKWKTLIDSIELKLIFKENLIASYCPLTLEEIKNYKQLITYEKERVKGYKLQLIDKNNKIINEYKSIREAAVKLKTAQKTISSLLNTDKLFRDIWYLKTQ